MCTVKLSIQGTCFGSGIGNKTAYKTSIRNKVEQKCICLAELGTASQFCVSENVKLRLKLRLTSTLCPSIPC